MGSEMCIRDRNNTVTLQEDRSRVLLVSRTWIKVDVSTILCNVPQKTLGNNTVTLQEDGSRVLLVSRTWIKVDVSTLLCKVPQKTLGNNTVTLQEVMIKLFVSRQV